MLNMPDYHQKQPPRRFYQELYPSTCIAIIIATIGLGILWSSYQYIKLYPNEHLATAIVYASSIIGWMISRNDRHKIMLNMANLILLAACFVAILQWQMMDNASVGSIFGNRNVFSYALILGIVISIDQGDYPTSYMYGIFVFLLGSRGAYIILITWLIIVYAAPTWKALTRWMSNVDMNNVDRASFIVFIAWFTNMVATIYLSSFWRSNDAIRFALWYKGLEDPLLFGHGTGSYNAWLETVLPGIPLWHTHNAIIQVWHELGVVAAIVIVGAVGILLVKLWKTNRSSSKLLVIMLIVSSSADYIYWYPGVLMVVAIVVTQHLLDSRSCQASEVDSGVSLAVASEHAKQTIF